MKTKLILFLGLILVIFPSYEWIHFEKKTNVNFIPEHNSENYHNIYKRSTGHIVHRL